jgi:DNA polymerase-3 subunit gamma/tau
MAQQYQVLARKWRPQQFDELVGQEHVTTTLKNAIEQNRLAHAYLFAGPRGVGKTSAARIFAKALNCLKGPTVTPCDRCDNCREIIAGNSLDVLEIDGASNRGIEEVRELRETVRYAPARGRFKIYIIDEVHMLTKEAFNALLKTLEEPPAHVKFFFATTEPQKLLPTILSRCQRFDLRRIPARLIVQQLKKIAAKEHVAVDEHALSAIARAAEGSLRDAESTLDQLIAFCGNRITEEDVLSVFGLVAHDQITALTDAVVDGHTHNALKILSELDEHGKDLQRLAAELLEHFRNLLVVTLGREAAESLQAPDTVLELLRTQSRRIDADAVLRIIDVLSAAETRLRYALSKRVHFEIALIKAIRARQATGIEAVLKTLTELRSRLTAAAEPAPAAQPGPAPKPASPAAGSAAADPGEPVAASTIEEAWADAVEHLGKVTPLARSYLVGARPVRLDGEVLVVAFEPEFAEQRVFVDTGRNRELLQARLKEKLRRDVRLRFEVAETGREVPAAKSAAKRPETAKKTYDDFKDDPLIKKALEIFKGTIVEVRK